MTDRILTEKEVAALLRLAKGCTFGEVNEDYLRFAHTISQMAALLERVMKCQRISGVGLDAQINDDIAALLEAYRGKR